MTNNYPDPESFFISFHNNNFHEINEIVIIIGFSLWADQTECLHPSNHSYTLNRNWVLRNHDWDKKSKSTKSKESERSSQVKGQSSSAFIVILHNISILSSTWDM